MTPLLEAAVAAREVGFDAPRCLNCQWCETCMSRAFPFECDPACEDCGGSGLRPVSDEDTGLCVDCDSTGLDASDPEHLIGRAQDWLLSKYAHPNLSLFPKTAHFTIHSSAYGSVVRLEHENHDGTPAGLATALLRLVARVGGKQ